MSLIKLKSVDENSSPQDCCPSHT